jgi:hypothetical protein
MKCRGLGASPLKAAPEKSKPGCCTAACDGSSAKTHWLRLHSKLHLKLHLNRSHAHLFLKALQQEPFGLRLGLDGIYLVPCQR